MASIKAPPSTMRAWQYSSIRGGLDKNLHLNSSAAVPKPTSNQHLVRVLATALNPVDYKLAEFGLFHRFIIPKPAIPGVDFAGELITPATGSSLKPGQLVFGAAGTLPYAGTSLAEYAISPAAHLIAIPDGVDPLKAATLTVAGLTAYQTIKPYVKSGDRVFINGGSGGTGVFGIQIAKALGCFVATTCSTPNVQLCQSLGADLVVDYKKEDIVQALEATGKSFDHVVDNVGGKMDLYWRCHEYTRKGAIYVQVGADLSWAFVFNAVKRTLWPGWLGGGKRKHIGFFPTAKQEDLEQVVNWVKEGKIRPVIDETFSFEEAPQAIEKLKTGRAKGKIVVNVALEDRGT